MTQSITHGFLVFALLVAFAVPSAAGAAVGSITIGDINGGAVLGASTQTLTDLQINAVLGLLQAFGADQSTVNNVRNALKGTTSPGTDTGSTPTTTTPPSNANEPPSDEGSSSSSSSASLSSSNEPVAITGTGYHEGKFYVKTALSGAGQKYRYLEKGVSVVLGGQTYQTTSGTRVGNVYVPNSLASQLLVGTSIMVLKPDIVVTGTGTSEGGKFFVKTSQSGPGGEYREIPLGDLFTIGGIQYRTIAGSGVGNIYLPDSAISQIAIGAVVMRGGSSSTSSPSSASTGLTDTEISSLLSLIRSFGASEALVEGASNVLRGSGGIKISHSLTDGQVTSVLSLLQSFGASASIIQDMEVFLGGSSQGNSGTPSLSITGPASGATFARTGDMLITWSVADVPHDMLVVGDVTLISASQPWQGTVSSGSFQATVHAGNSTGSHLWQLGSNDSVAGTYSIKLKLQECLNNDCSLNPNVPGTAPTNVLAYSALGGTVTVLRSTTSASLGSLSVTTDASSPTYAIVAAGSDDVIVGVYKVTASAVEDVRLTRLGLQLTNGKSTDLGEVSVWDGATKLGSVFFTGTNTHATATLSNIIPKGISKSLNIRADLSPIGTGQPVTQSGSLVAINADTAGSNSEAVGVTSGNIIHPTGSTSVAGVRVMKSLPAVGLSSSSAGGLSSTGVEDGRLMRFKVSADSHNPISIGKLHFAVTPSGLSISNVKLYGYTDAGYSSPISGVGADGSVPTVVFGPNVFIATPENPIQIPDGGARYFELRATVSGASSGSVVFSRLLGDSNFPGSNGSLLPLSAFPNEKDWGFIWSPNSTTTSSFSHNDWTNSFGVPGLPSGGISQIRKGGSTTTSACSDGIDNDGDSFKDAEDPGCSNASDNDEYNAPATAAAPGCTLSASPSTVTAGGSVTLNWHTSNATSFSINQSVGVVGPVSSGSKSVVVPSTRTYTGTATGSGGTAYCGTTVTTSAPAPESTTSSQPTVTSTGYYNGIFYAKTTASQSGEAYRTTQKGETFVIGGKAYQTVGGSNVGSIYLPTSADGVIQVGDTVVRPTAP